VRMGRPNQTHDRLDALLDGRPGEVTDDLAPLLAAAEALRADLADLEIDPEVVDRHLEQALDRPATVVPLPVRNVGTGGSVLRRRLAAAGLAAALVLVPATAASAASSDALPGQALYPVKLAVEQFRLAAVQWSPTREAQERAKLAAMRLKELNRLVELQMFRQVPTAIRALDKAVADAEAAVAEAAEAEGTDVAPELAAVLDTLIDVAVAQYGELRDLKAMGSQLSSAITLAVAASPADEQPNLPEVPPVLQSVVTTTPPLVTEQPPVTSTPPPVTEQPPVTTSPPPATPPEPPVTTAPPPPPSEPTTTAPPNPTTTQPPEGTEGTPGAEGNPATGAADRGASPTTTLPQ
jgi:Domain of unknown function (DUF5667)